MLLYLYPSGLWAALFQLKNGSVGPSVSWSETSHHHNVGPKKKGVERERLQEGRMTT